VTDHDDGKWDCPPHTKAKHEMLAKYLDAWYPIIASWNGRLVFLDGFAGRGRYTDGSEGSPLIALRRLIDHRLFRPRGGTPANQGR
jgi:three-Cys-motif partner protein